MGDCSPNPSSTPLIDATVWGWICYLMLNNILFIRSMSFVALFEVVLSLVLLCWKASKHSGIVCPMRGICVNWISYDAVKFKVWKMLYIHVILFRAMTFVQVKQALSSYFHMLCFGWLQDKNKSILFGYVSAFCNCIQITVRTLYPASCGYL